jgi:hypothetical protein
MLTRDCSNRLLDGAPSCAVFPIIVTTQGRTEPSHSGRDRKPPGDYDQYDTRQQVKTVGQSSSDRNCAKRNNRKDENEPD